MNTHISSLAQQVLASGLLDGQQIDSLAEQSKTAFFDLLYWANRIREKFFGSSVKICCIVPGKLGGCDQDCKFCAQSARYKTNVGRPRLVSDEEILQSARRAKRHNVPNFGIVYSGRSITEKQFVRLQRLIKRIKADFGLQVCASVGIISLKQAKRLVQAGLSRYNHNLETSRRHFPNIVTTHSYDERVRTIIAAKQAGLGVCAGGIFGIGENEQDRVSMALELRSLGVDSVPMNFLHPIEGTPLGNCPTLSPREILRIIAIYRFILPDTHLKIAGGRVLNLRNLQSWMFYAGATSILSGNYLTTTGRPVREDLQMLRDLGLEPVLLV